MKASPHHLLWIEELLPEDFVRKPMFGGFAYYWNQKIMLVVFEKPGDKEHRGQIYPFDLWDGCLFPLERDHHPEATRLFSDLIPHPVLPKWFYLPTATEGFDEVVGEILREMKRPISIWGVTPQKKKKKSSKGKARARRKAQQ